MVNGAIFLIFFSFVHSFIYIYLLVRGAGFARSRMGAVCKGEREFWRGLGTRFRDG